MTQAEFESALHTHQAMVYSIAHHFLAERRGGGSRPGRVPRVFQAKRAPASPAHLTAWLRRVTVHRCIDATRRAGSAMRCSSRTCPRSPTARRRPIPCLRDCCARWWPHCPTHPGGHHPPWRGHGRQRHQRDAGTASANRLEPPATRYRAAPREGRATPAREGLCARQMTICAKR